MTRKAAIREDMITKAVMDAWRKTGLPNTLVASIPNMAAHGQYGLTPGLFDLIVIAPGLPVGFLEIKTEVGRLSEHQKRFREHLVRAAVPYRVTYGLDQALECLRDWRVIREAAA